MPAEPVVDPEVLRTARERAGLTQHELARLIGVAGGERISRWELGTSRPRGYKVLHRLADALAIEPNALLVPAREGPDLRRLRFIAGLSTRQLAKQARMSEGNLSHWEAGHAMRIPARVALKPLARPSGSPSRKWNVRWCGVASSGAGREPGADGSSRLTEGGVGVRGRLHRR
jgi:transcriptional regulator with XRE-family HTH domain